MREVVIVSCARTAQGNFGGSLKDIKATQLGAIVMAEAVRRAGIEKKQVDEAIMGMVLPCGYGQNPAKQAAVLGGFPWELECLTVNKVCGSALKAVMLASQAIAVGDADIVVAGGMENMSFAPYYLEKARYGYRMGPSTFQDHMVHDGLWDIVNDFHMGVSNELCCKKYNVSREDQDRYALESYRRALSAMREGLFKDEIVPVEVPQRKGPPKIFDQDECPRKTSYEDLAKMPSAFVKDGVTTAGNASVISDGAAAVVVMSREKAEALGCNIMATVRAQASAGLDMKYVLMAPILAIPKVLAKEDLRIEDMDVIEVNEAFSGSTVAVMRELKIDHDKLNVNGGGVALGHPIGASGGRTLIFLMNELKRRNGIYGLVSLCLGGGEAVALIIKRGED
ncbi:MAG: acetyl-CoA C-acetyltransferase [Deltaproteobacteria bacterium]|nr:acetyl-CoA C-acetyltransferase [Deltaproteobacteria bacterium]